MAQEMKWAGGLGVQRPVCLGESPLARAVANGGRVVRGIELRCGCCGSSARTQPPVQANGPAVGGWR
jgi:hypothetical protein